MSQHIAKRDDGITLKDACKKLWRVFTQLSQCVACNLELAFHGRSDTSRR